MTRHDTFIDFIDDSPLFLICSSNSCQVPLEGICLSIELPLGGRHVADKMDSSDSTITLLDDIAAKMESTDAADDAAAAAKKNSRKGKHTDVGTHKEAKSKHTEIDDSIQDALDQELETIEWEWTCKQLRDWGSIEAKKQVQCTNISVIKRVVRLRIP